MHSRIFILAVSIMLAQNLVAAPTNGTILLTELGVKNLGLETEIAEESDFEKTTFALGRTEVIPEKRAILSSRISGRVLENRLKVGSYVEKGEPLLLLESRQPGDPPPNIWLNAPASGTIVSVNTALGAPVEPTERLAEIADLSTLYLIATMPQATAGKIGQGTKATVHFPLRPEKPYVATLLDFAACPCPDPACALGQNLSTRSEENPTTDLNSAGVIFTLNNPDNQLRPGMNAECSIIMEKRTQVLSVSRTALQGSPSNRHVYVQHSKIPNAFDRVSVQTGLTSNDRVEILDGLFPGDVVVTRGSYALGFAGSSGGPSLKEALDAAHGHEHNEDGSELTPEQKLANTQTGHASESQGEHGANHRELIFMISTGILTVLVLVLAFRRRDTNAQNAELS